MGVVEGGVGPGGVIAGVEAPLAVEGDEGLAIAGEVEGGWSGMGRSLRSQDFLPGWGLLGQGWNREQGQDGGEGQASAIGAMGHQPDFSWKFSRRSGNGNLT